MTKTDNRGKHPNALANLKFGPDASRYTAAAIANRIIQGQRHADSGHTARLPHIRWHVNRGITNPKCPHCVED